MVAEEPAGTRRLRALVVDDEAPAREELAYLLRHDERVGYVSTAAGAAQALELLTVKGIDVVFCDIKMPGLDGMHLARVLARFTERPQIVFVTAYDDHAVDAFELEATDYLMKPVRADRLAEAVRRVVSTGSPEHKELEDETLPVELARIPLTVLEQRWSAAGFARIHRSTLVALAHVEEVRMLNGHCSVRLGDEELPVSRRHTRELRSRLQGEGDR